MGEFRWRGILLGLLLGCPLVGEGAVKQPVRPLPEPSVGACENLQKLADLGLVRLPAGYPETETARFTREEITDLTLQAMEHLGMDAQGRIGGQPGDTVPGGKETLALRQEFYRELRNRGMLEDWNLLTDLKPSSEASDEKKDEDRKYKFSAELRYNYVDHSGSPRWDWRDKGDLAPLYRENTIHKHSQVHAAGGVPAPYLSSHKKKTSLLKHLVLIQ